MNCSSKSAGVNMIGRKFPVTLLPKVARMRVITRRRLVLSSLLSNLPFGLKVASGACGPSLLCRTIYCCLLFALSCDGLTAWCRSHASPKVIRCRGCCEFHYGFTHCLDKATFGRSNCVVSLILAQTTTTCRFFYDIERHACISSA